ncbi:MAG TPA: DUF4091 domain-containing protein [Tepidisphaeraceae bacterium]|jgi:hypothetical protein|nr:DUF4091 domain-containing protein [Tepidisphaeraceae bacterium]
MRGLPFLLLLGFLSQALLAADKPVDVSAWLTTSLQRVFPASPPGEKTLSLLAARHGRIAFQACIRNGRTQPTAVECAIRGADDLNPQIRFVGLVPMPHLTPHTDPKELDGAGMLPGLVPDPLMPERKATIGMNESRSFWITLTIPSDAKPGPRELQVTLTIDGGKTNIELPVKLEISDFTIQPRKDFHVIHWWRGEATWDYYHTEMFDQRWYDLTKAQLEDMLAHGSDVVYVPIFFNRRETFRRPCQLLIVDEPETGKYVFDWSEVKKFVTMCKQIGFKRFEWSHIWIYWGVENPIRVYRKVDGQYVMLWPPNEKATGPVYVNFLKQFLPEFKKFLDDEGILETSYFHLSDEPGSGQHIENYKRARQVLRELAPWMKVMDALSDVNYGKQGLTDIPIPIVSSAKAYVDAKIPHWVYYCCGPTGAWLNRFLDTPLPKVRMSGLLFYRFGANGFLHWGFNYWHKMEKEEIGDPWHDASNSSWPGIPYGDPFMIYPGPDGPIDSLRWEVFAEALQDYAILQTAGIEPDDPMLADLKTYANFPKNEEWIRAAMEKILRSKAGAK